MTQVMQRQQPILEDPSILFNRDRMDYVVKYRYFCSLINGIDLKYTESIYIWHILKRTKGKEPDGSKHSIDDYLKGCRDLLDSIQTNGFDVNRPIKIGLNNLLVGSGAHRISVCKALNIRIPVTYVNENGPFSWDYSWFVHKGMKKEDLCVLLNNWNDIRRDVWLS